MANDTKAKDEAMELAEAAREAEWKFPSFTAALFRGDFLWNLMHPYPVQSEEDKKIGDELIEKVRGVLEAHLDPIEVDRTGVYPQKALDELAGLGVFGMKIAKEYGGLGLSVVNYSRVISFISSYCQSTITWVSAHQSIGAPEPLKLFGTEEQKKKYLPRLAKGEISAFALTEPGVGSDPAKMKTTATPSEDGTYYTLYGRKLWITNGPDAKIIVVMARTPSIIKDGKEIPQISAFLVETDSPGFRVAHRCQFMGLRGCSIGELVFESVKVPAENIVGQLGQGLKIALTTLNAGRLGVPAAGAGVAKSLLGPMRKWTTERVQWGRPVGEHQAVGTKVARFAADTFAMESMIRLTCAFADKKNADIRLEAAAAKYFCTETVWHNLDELVQILGGRGYETATSIHGRGEYPYFVERVLRDSRIGRIFEGSSQVMHLIMAREAMDMHLSVMMPILMPKSKDRKKSLLSRIGAAVKLYATWYPKVWMPASVDFNVKYLSEGNRAHLAFAARTSKKLARHLFHTMALYGPKMEEEQLILASYVDIGVDLFVMGAALARAESLLALNPSDTTPDELASLFCQYARARIAKNFKAARKNNAHFAMRVAKRVMSGDMEWMATDVYTDLPPAYRNFEENQTPMAPPAKGEK